MRIALEQVAVLERPRLALVGVDDEVDGTGVVLGDERPLHARREAGAAEAAQVRLLDLVGDRRRLHRRAPCPRPRSRRVAAVDRERVGVRDRSKFAREDVLGSSAQPLEDAVDLLGRQVQLVAVVDLHHRRRLARAQALDRDWSVTRPSSVVSPSSMPSRCFTCAMMSRRAGQVAGEVVAHRHDVAALRRCWKYSV